ncbi:MAG: FAD:protein FMN transferase [Opitutales bacterium]|nr:FAD:protein FMN transferase [Opitutales bacterium]
MIFNYTTSAMNSDLRLCVDAERENYAKSAAYDLFEELKKLDELLSMYVMYSAITRINSLEVGDTLKILDTTAQALGAAMYVSRITKGAVDVCMGEFFQNLKGKEKIENPRQAQIKIFPEDLIVKKLADGKVDLGAIGKGFALDFLAERLVNMWGIDRALFNFGSSSILALNPPEGESCWEISFGGRKLEGFEFKNASIGSSGTAVQGSHIMDCRTRSVPENMPYRTWAVCGNAVIADALSTAFMLLSREEIIEAAAAENAKAIIQQTPDSPLEILA